MHCRCARRSPPPRRAPSAAGAAGPIGPSAGWPRGCAPAIPTRWPRPTGPTGPRPSACLLRLLGDRAAAEDVQQQVFTEVWRRAGDYDPRRAGLLTWVLTIARSRAIDHLRRRVPEPRDPQLPDPRTVPADADALLERWRVAHLLGRLPENERALLRLRFYDELSQSEISAATDIPIGTVKARMVRGLTRLREMIEAEGA